MFAVTERIAAAPPPPAVKTIGYEIIPRYREYINASWWAAIWAESAVQCGKACVEQSLCKLFTWIGGGFTFALDGNPNCMLVSGRALVSTPEVSFTAMSGTGASQPCTGRLEQ